MYYRAILFKFYQLRQQDLNSDFELWRQVREGNREAYFAIYDIYIEDLIRYGCKFTTDRDRVKDCIHDLFVDIWERRANLGDTNSIKYYLLRALRRRIAHQLPAHLSLSDHDEKSKQKEVSYPAYEFKWLVEEQNQEVQQAFSQMLNALPARQKEIIYLRFYDNLSFQEIADMLSIDLRSAYNLTYKALANMRSFLKNHTTLSNIIHLLMLGLLIFFFV